MRINPEKWNYVTPSLMNGVKAIDFVNQKFKLWAGTSGCNFSMTDERGGQHSFLELDPNIYNFYETIKVK